MGSAHYAVAVAPVKLLCSTASYGLEGDAPRPFRYHSPGQE